MGSLRQRAYEIPIPADAEYVSKGGLQIARWRHRRHLIEAEVVRPGIGLRTTKIWVARITDATGKQIDRSTGCRDRANAERKMHEFEREIERIKAGIITIDESKQIEQAKYPVAKHLDDYIQYLEVLGRTDRHRHQTRRHIERACQACGFHRLGDFDSGKLEKWMADGIRRGKSGRTVNATRVALVAFVNWLCESQPPRVAKNPFLRVPRAREDDVHIGRHLTTEELARLFRAAEERPLLAAQTLNRGPLKGQLGAKVTDIRAARLKRLGIERRVYYSILSSVNIRPISVWGLFWESTHLDGPSPHFVLEAKFVKKRKKSVIALSPWTTKVLLEWKTVSGGTRGLVIRPPANAAKIFEADRIHAGIEKVTDAGIASLYSLRHSYGTFLAESGANPWELKDALGHESVSTSERHYVRLRANHARDAISAVGSMIESAVEPPRRAKESRATGTEGASEDCPSNCPYPAVREGQNTSLRDVQDAPENEIAGFADVRKTGDNDLKRGLSTSARGRDRTFDPLIKSHDSSKFEKSPITQSGKGLRQISHDGAPRIAPQTALVTVEDLATQFLALSDDDRRRFFEAIKNVSRRGLY